MLVTRFVSSYKKAEQFQLWQQLRQQPDQTVNVFLTKVSSMAAIGGYLGSAALLVSMAMGLTPKAIATSAKCRELILIEEAYIYKEDVMMPFNVLDRVSRPMDSKTVKVGIRKCMKCGQVGHRETTCTNAAACNWCTSKTHFRATCPTAPRKPPVASSEPTVAMTDGSKYANTTWG